MTHAGEPARSPVHVACIQMEPHVGATRDNLDKSVALIEQAAADGARLVVLPELCNSGYVFESRAEAFSLAEPVPGGETTQRWSEIARRRGLILVAGIAERSGDALYNAAVVIGPVGHIGTYRKNHLWGIENLFFEPGDLGMPVWKTPVGRIAVAICYDLWFPELFRLAALQGADILCLPTNWVPMPEQPEDGMRMANILAMAGAHSNALFVAAADRIGIERGQPFLGSSVIVRPTGWLAAGPASTDREEIISASLDLSAARSRRVLTPFNQVLRDRRTDVYDEMLGAEARRGWY